MNDIEKLEFSIEIAEQSILVSMDNIEADKQELKELKEKKNARTN